ncbi:MAG: protein-L-isoaspartate(D-aspartate) O-methyltransferase [Gammaproteobacteria bacterium]|nr:protein-L-isoaspartate(D-aspartate) O-methyltransferase [Gammaproteobacteria bacterium]
MNFEQARENMIKQQIRPWEVADQRTLDLLAEIHREDFVPEPYKYLALADINIPLLHNQITMTPKVEARLLQDLAIQPHEKILEIGTGCGYLTALLANSGKIVHSIDIYPEFKEHASPRFKQYGLQNIHVHVGDAVRGWPQEAPYDVIVVTGSVPLLEWYFQEQLQTGGRMFVIVGQSPAMEARLITRTGPDTWNVTSLFETDLPPLVGAPKPESFRF